MSNLVWTSAPVPKTTRKMPVILRSYVDHGYYCTLIGNSNQTHKKHVYVFYTSDPISSTIKYNDKTIGNRETKTVAPYWRLCGTAGPFKSLSGVKSCSKFFVNETRGAPSKQKRIPDFALRYGVSCYQKDVEPPGGSMTAYLKKHAPLEYQLLYEDTLAQQQQQQQS